MQRFQSTATEVLGEYNFPIDLNLVFERTLSLSMPDMYATSEEMDMQKLSYSFDFGPNNNAAPSAAAAAKAEPSWESNLVNTPKMGGEGKKTPATSSSSSSAANVITATSTLATFGSVTPIVRSTPPAQVKASARLQQVAAKVGGTASKVTPFSSKKAAPAPVIQHHQSSTSQSSDEDYDEDYDGGDVGKRSHYKALTASQKREYRRERNRELAAESRERKRIEFEQMKEEIVLLRKENAELRSKLSLPSLPVNLVVPSTQLHFPAASVENQAAKRRRRTNSAALSEGF